jgi:hypothetical protein
VAGERRGRGCEDRLLGILVALLGRSARLQRDELVKDGAGILLVSIWLDQEHLELLKVGQLGEGPVLRNLSDLGDFDGVVGGGGVPQR